MRTFFKNSGFCMHIVNEKNVELTEVKPLQSDFFPEISAQEIRLVSSEETVAVFCRGLCIFLFEKGDRFSRNYCLVQLHLAGGISLSRLARLFGLSYQHCSRVLSLYKKEGVDGLREDTSKRFGNRRLIDDEIAAFIEGERGKGRTFGEIAEIIRFKFKKRIREKSIRAWMSQREEVSDKIDFQLEMPVVSEEAESQFGVGLEADGWRRNIYAGSMILYGLIEWSGCLKPFARYIVEDEKERESASSVQRVILTLFFLHALRYKNVEQSKYPVGMDFADLVGGDFLRLQPLRYAIDDIVQHPGFDLAIEAYYRNLICMTERGDRIYYTDGHFSTYYGKRKVPKGWDPRRPQPSKGRNTIYLHNSAGLNVYLFESPTNTTLSNDIEKLVTDMASFGMKIKRRTLFFDRGGYSSKCFRYLQTRKMYFGTYLKNRKKERECALSDFKVHKFRAEDGEEFEYQIFEKEKRWTKFGRMRIIVFLSKDGRQIPVITNNPFLRPATVVYLLSRRWREENSFKYMIEHFAIDVLCTYKTEKAPDKIVRRANLERQELSRQIQKKKFEMTKLKEELAEKYLVSRSQTMEEFSESQKQLEFKIKNIQLDIDLLDRKKLGCPTKTEINLSEEHVIIVQKRRLFINAIKAMNYNAEKWFQIMFQEHYPKPDETLCLIASLWKRPGKIKTDGPTVDVVLDPLEMKAMRESLRKVLEKLRENNHLRLPDGRLLRIS